MFWDLIVLYTLSNYSLEFIDFSFFFIYCYFITKRLYFVVFDTWDFNISDFERLIILTAKKIKLYFITFLIYFNFFVHFIVHKTSDFKKLQRFNFII